MLNKRAAILAVFSGVLAKMAHADDPNWKPVPISQLPISQFGSAGLIGLNAPTTWSVNLDAMKSLDVMFDGKKVTITPAELFAALAS